MSEAEKINSRDIVDLLNDREVVQAIDLIWKMSMAGFSSYKDIIFFELISKNKKDSVPFLHACREIVQNKDNNDFEIDKLKTWAKNTEVIKEKINYQNKEIKNIASALNSQQLLSAIYCAEAAIYFINNDFNNFFDKIEEAVKSLSPDGNFRLKARDIEVDCIDDLYKSVSATKESLEHLDFCLHLIKWLTGQESAIEQVKRIIKFPYYRPSTKKCEIGKLSVELHDYGSGSIVPDPIIHPFFTYDDIALSTIKNIREYLKSSGYEDRLKSKHITWTVYNPEGQPLDHITQSSFGGALAVCIISLLENKEIDPGFCISAGIDSNGNMLEVGYMPEKTEAVQNNSTLNSLIVSSDNYEEACRYSKSGFIQKALTVKEAQSIVSNEINDFIDYLKNLREELRILPGYYPDNYNMEDININIHIKDYNKNKETKQLKAPIIYSADNDVFHRNVILGDPGQGKTWILKYRALKEIKTILNELEDSKKSLNDIPLPIFIRLAEFADLIDDKNSVLGIKDEIVTYIRRDKKISEHLLRDKIENGKIMLFLDALDEVSNKDKKKSLNGGLKSFLRKNANCKVLLSSRREGYEFPSKDCHLKEMEVQNLDDGQIKQFVKNWIKCSICDSESDIDDQTSNIIMSLQKSSSIYKLASIPLFLSFICLLYDEGETDKIGSKTHIIYRSCKKLLKTWRSEKENGASPDQSEIDCKIRILEFVGYNLFITGRERCSYSEFVELIKRALTEAYQISYIKSDYGKFFEELAKDGIIVKISGSDDCDYMFLHRSLLEYLTASYIARHDEWLELLSRHFSDIHWADVISMAASLNKYAHAKTFCSENNKYKVDPSKLISSILNNSNDRLSNCYLASSCFAELDEDIRKIPEIIELFEGFIRELFRKLKENSIHKEKLSDEKLLAFNTIVDALAIIGDKYIIDLAVDYWRKENIEDAEYALALSKVLGKMQAKEALKGLFNIIDIILKDSFYYLDKIGDNFLDFIIMEDLYRYNTKEVPQYLLPKLVDDSLCFGPDPWGYLFYITHMELSNIDKIFYLLAKSEFDDPGLIADIILTHGHFDTIPFFITQLNSSDKNKQFCSSYILGKLGLGEAKTVLLDMLKTEAEGHDFINFEYLIAIENIRLKEALPLLQKLLLKFDSEYQFNKYIETIAALGESATLKIIDDYKSKLKDKYSETKKRAETTVALDSFVDELSISPVKIGEYNFYGSDISFSVPLKNIEEPIKNSYHRIISAVKLLLNNLKNENILDETKSLLSSVIPISAVNELYYIQDEFIESAAPYIAARCWVTNNRQPFLNDAIMLSVNENPYKREFGFKLYNALIEAPAIR